MNPNQRKRRDRFALAGALVLLLAVVVGWWILASRTEERRTEALAGVPDFPAPGQVPARREPNEKLVKAIARPKPIDAGSIAHPRKVDRLNAFVLASAQMVTLIQVNALFNTPLFDRFRECAPHELKQAEAAAKERGIDLEHDIDRMAMVPGGVAVSGFFEGKPLAEALAEQSGGAQQSDYRGQTIYQMANGTCVVQLGDLLLLGNPLAQGCEPLIDRALDPPADANAVDELYGDLYMHTDLRALANLADVSQDSSADAFAQLFESLSGATVRANVWDDVAVSFEGDPKSADQLRDLSNLARGALSVGKGQIGDDDDKLQALADLANVQSENGKLKIDLALPADQLFSRLHIPCPGMADAGAN